MEVQQDVPFSIEDVTAEWLAAGLTNVGLLKEGTIPEISVNVLSEQVGFNGEVAIISPVYTVPSENLPSTLVLKIPTASRNRIMGQTMGLYEKEIRFYRDLQPRLNIRVPHHYYSALDVADDPDVYLERLEGMNRLPIWIIRIIVSLASRFVAGNPRKYALLIEDLSGFRMGDQTRGCSDEDIHRIIETMARLHAQFWNSEELQSMTWVAPYSATSRIMQMRYLQFIKRYLSEESQNLSNQQKTMLGWLKTNGITLSEVFGGSSMTLLHGDFRLDNICFNDATGELVLFDWQTLIAGPAGSDLAYFISATLPEDTSESRINELIDRYHAALARDGVEISRSQVRWQYETGMLSALHRLLPTTYDDQMDLDTERGLPLLQAWVQRIYRRLEHCDYQRALDP